MDNLKVIHTHTGKIYVDRKRQLEFLTVGDYGKENNIKADFLGYTKEIHGVQNTKVNLEEKWVATISSQKGCPMKCRFCDCPKYGFHGNVKRNELSYQVGTILAGEAVTHTKRFNLHVARMGEPTFNWDVISYIENDLYRQVNTHIRADVIHPVVSTMLPANNRFLLDFLREWCIAKNQLFRGEAGLQFSINSTDDHQRETQFGGMSISLKDISYLADILPDPVGRKYTLNFAVTNDTILDAEKLSEYFDNEKFIVKLTPIHQTKSAVQNGFDIGSSYEDYDVYRKFEEPLLAQGWDVIVFVPSAEEDSDRITCGNALISEMEEKNEHQN